MALSDRVVNFVVKITGDTKDLQRDLKGVEKQAEQTTSRLSTRLKGLWEAASVGALAAGGAAIAKQQIDAASNLAESSSKAAQIFGDNVQEITKYSEEAAQKIGLSQRAALDAASGFAILGQAAGVTGSDLVDFSTDMTGLASDLASFNNTSVQDAIDAISAGLRGESEPLRRYGVLLDDATLKSRALAMGIYDGSGALTQQQKVMAAQAEILAQTTTQQGDFSRTSDGLANSTKRLSAEFENLQAQFGENLAPAVAEGVSALSTMAGAIGDIQSAIDGLPRPLNGFLEGMGKGGILPAIYGGLKQTGQLVGIIGDEAEEAESKVGTYRREVEFLGDEMEVFSGTAKVANDRIREGWREAAEFEDMARRAARAMKEWEAQQERFTDAIKKYRGELKYARDDERALEDAIRSRISAATDGLSGFLDMADAQASFGDAVQNWLDLNHIAANAGKPGEFENVDPAQAQRDADAALRDAVRAALRLAEVGSAAISDPRAAAQAQADSLAAAVAANPWLASSLNPTIAQLRTAAMYQQPAIPFTSKQGSGSIVVTGGADPYLSLQAAQDFASRNGNTAW